MRGEYRWRCNNHRPERTPDPSSASRRGTSWTIAIGAAVSSARDTPIAVSSISSRATSLGSRSPRNRHQAPRLMEFRIDRALLPGSGLLKSEYFRARRQIDEPVNADQPIHNGNLANSARSDDGKKTLPLRAEPQHGRRQIPLSSYQYGLHYPRLCPAKVAPSVVPGTAHSVLLLHLLAALCFVQGMALRAKGPYAATRL
jgi:hypothetical protein